MTLRIFTDPTYSEPGTLLCPLLLPWTAEFKGHPTVADPIYAQSGTRYFERVETADSDFILCPLTWRDDRDNDPVRSFIQDHHTFKRPIVVFCETDSEAPFPLAGATVFRGSLLRSQRMSWEHALPAFITDPWERHGAALEAQQRNRIKLPVVGFCGQLDTWADSRLALQRKLGRAIYQSLLSRPGLERRLRRLGMRITRNEGKRVRHQAVGVVSRSPLLQSNFNLRDHFINGVLALPAEEREAHYMRVHREFCANILESDYVLCPRGGGNWSYRLYETLALGRVPVFINTDSVLPYEDRVAWRDYCVWVEGDAIETLPALVYEHYRSHSEDSLQAQQKRCRELWRDFLSLDGFFRHFHEHQCWNVRRG